MGLFLHRISTLVQFFLYLDQTGSHFWGVEATDQPLKNVENIDRGSWKE
jgi:hypothetical protein